MTQNPAFETHYRNIYGSRWETLRESLLAPVRSVAFDEGLSKAYTLDYASVLAARSLRLPHVETGFPSGSGTGGEILDACAAPGGKTLVIAGRLRGDERLLANEISAGRRRRLHAVLDEHLGPEQRERVRVSGFDAAALGRRRDEWGRFDGILLDAPCSAERHVLANALELSRWTEARPRFLSGRQWALLSAAFLLLKPGGSLVYATCALDPRENDGVAGRLLEKYGRAGRKDAAFLDPPDFAEGEATRYGRIILPDTGGGAFGDAIGDSSGGWGPMYVARFRKGAWQQ
ncbi:MAG: 16S rRNA methyltransferase [Treponema sp.]|jgi:16S rRNA (cytosine1407-C5)-methyltransferase|nr:16S rRNA methyltransferase [Treponema sp.]